MRLMPGAVATSRAVASLRQGAPALPSPRGALATRTQMRRQIGDSIAARAASTNEADLGSSTEVSTLSFCDSGSPCREFEAAATPAALVWRATAAAGPAIPACQPPGG